MHFTLNEQTSLCSIFSDMRFWLFLCSRQPDARVFMHFVFWKRNEPARFRLHIVDNTINLSTSALYNDKATLHRQTRSRYSVWQINSRKGWWLFLSTNFYTQNNLFQLWKRWKVRDIEISRFNTFKAQSW